MNTQNKYQVKDSQSLTNNERLDDEEEEKSSSSESEREEQEHYDFWLWEMFYKRR